MDEPRTESNGNGDSDPKNPTPENTGFDSGNEIPEAQRPQYYTTKKNEQGWIYKYKPNGIDWNLWVNIGIFFTAVIVVFISGAQYKDGIESSRISDSIAHERFKKDTAVTNAQIKALNGQVAAMNQAVNEMKKQFEIENTPYLTIVDIIATQVEKDKPLAFSFYVANTSQNGSAQIIESKFSVIFSFSIKMPIEKNRFENISSSEKIYVIKDRWRLEFNDKTKMSSDEYDRFINKRERIFLLADCTYIDLATNKKRKFKFVQMITAFSPVATGVILQNDNDPIE